MAITAKGLNKLGYTAGTDFILEDNDGRKFQLRGVPDIVIKFKNKNDGYGIIDFKTTNLSNTKSDNYKYQLEAYAQIFKKPGATKTAPSPKLEPITHMGVLQFFPEKIFKHQISDCDLKMQMSYSPLKRNEEDFFKHITNLINFSGVCEKLASFLLLYQ